MKPKKVMPTRVVRGWAPIVRALARRTTPTALICTPAARTSTPAKSKSDPDPDRGACRRLRTPGRAPVSDLPGAWQRSSPGPQGTRDASRAAEGPGSRCRSDRGCPQDPGLEATAGSVSRVIVEGEDRPRMRVGPDFLCLKSSDLSMSRLQRSKEESRDLSTNRCCALRVGGCRLRVLTQTRGSRDDGRSGSARRRIERCGDREDFGARTAGKSGSAPGDKPKKPTKT